MKIVLCGLSITSSWGNGHATNYRALVRGLTARGHEVLFLERDMPWYASQRDLPEPPWGRTELYGSLQELERFAGDVAAADLVVIGSYVPEGVAVAEWVLDRASGAVAFYDIDTPVTLAKLRRGDPEYLSPALVGRFDLYLSFTGGPTLQVLEEEFGARRALAFYCLVDPDAYRPLQETPYWDLGYLGTYSDDRQPVLERLLIEPARLLPDGDFAVAGPQYPEEIEWPENVERIEHVAPNDHPRFYASQRFTLNVTRAQMREAGWSPSVRLFEAAACAVPVISDRWEGLDQIFTPGEEILIADSAEDVLRYLTETGEDKRLALGERARARVLAEHTAERRCEQLEQEVAEAAGAR
ncbi:MAG TPA: glycosyltransferase [Solirubrobacterales bacterium]|jgi:spore maturation protein CgeB|nr:glycosyltransferase [Solirubrobacterales bacterium]